MLKKDGTLKAVYETPFNFLLVNSQNKSCKFYGKQWSGSRKHMRFNSGAYSYFRDFVEFAGIKYTRGNDAPRRGIEGDYILVSLDARNKIVKMLRSIKTYVAEIEMYGSIEIISNLDYCRKSFERYLKEIV